MDRRICVVTIFAALTLGLTETAGLTLFERAYTVAVIVGIYAGRDIWTGLAYADISLTRETAQTIIVCGTAEGLTTATRRAKIDGTCANSGAHEAKQDRTVNRFLHNRTSE